MDRTALGILIPQRNPSLNVLNAIPDMTFSGNIQNSANPSMSDGTPYFNQNTIYSFIDNVSKVWGTHSLKVGLYFEHTQKIQSANAFTRGSISFNQDGNNALDANDPYGTALLGNYDSYAESTGRPQGNYKYTNTEWFVQDTWRVRSQPVAGLRRPLLSRSAAVRCPASVRLVLDRRPTIRPMRRCCCGRRRSTA